MSGQVEAHSHVELNGVKHFDLEFKQEGNGKAHLKIEAHRAGHTSHIHYHREGWSNISFTFNRDGKEFKVEANGNLPQKGHLEINIYNSFRATPRTINAKIDLDRTASPKILKIEVMPYPSKLYIFDLKYNADLSRKSVGDFELHITTPTRDAARWKNISGKWDFSKPQHQLELDISGTKYHAEGQFGLRESDLKLTSSNKAVDDVFMQWNFKRQGSNRDYFMKVGRESNYFMFK